MYKRQLKTIKPYFLKEASFLSGSLQKVIINMVKILQKRLGQRLLGDVDTVFTVHKPSGYYSGVKFYVGKNGTAIRFNWLMGKNATLHSIDIFHKFRTQPLNTLEVIDLNINQVLEALTEHLSTGQTQIAVNEYDEKGYPVLREISFGGLTAIFKKAEKEIPQVETETEQVVKKVKFKALEGTQIFEQIERYTEAILNKTTPKNVLIVAGDAGTGKSVSVTNVLKKLAGPNSKPTLKGLPPVGSERIKKVLKNPDGTMKSIQSALAELGDYVPPVEKSWMIGSQDVKGDELFIDFYQGNGKVIVYDDADNVFTIKENKLLLKQALDTKPVRPLKIASKVPYVNLGAKVGIIPKEFNFSGRVIIITNRTPGQIEDAILSRALLVDVDLSPKQFMDRLRSLLPIIQKNEAQQIGLDKFQEVFDWLYDLFITKKAMSKFDIRTFVHLVFEYQILNGDRGLWESIAAMAIKQAYPGSGIVIE